MLNDCDWRPNRQLLAAWTVIAASWRRATSRSMAAAVVTTPVLASIVKQAVRVAGQTVSDRVVGRIQVEGIGGDADGGADDGVLRDFIGCAVVSVGMLTSNSSRSLIVMLND